MPVVIEKTVFTFDELDSRAKERARDWYRSCMDTTDYADSVLEDFERVCAIIGVDLATHNVRLYGGGTRQKPSIYWSGFSSQGDGACFEGSYAYAKGSAKAIREYAPQDTKLHAIANTLATLQRSNFYSLSATVKHSGRYYHEYCMDIDVCRLGERAVAKLDDIVTSLLRDLARWLYRQLEAEYEYHTSDAAIDESIEENEYTFDENGNRED